MTFTTPVSWGWEKRGAEIAVQRRSEVMKWLIL
jgi:hypothetical protein